MRLEEVLRNAVYDKYNLCLRDSPQIFHDYLYLEFWFHDRGIKIRHRDGYHYSDFMALDTEGKVRYITDVVLCELMRRYGDFD